MRKIAIIDERAPDGVIRSLELRGYSVITLPSYSKLGEALKSHTDMLLLKTKDTLFFFADYCDERMYVLDDLYTALKDKGYKFSFLQDVPSSEYPNDAKINVLIMGKKVFARREGISPSLILYFAENGYEIINVKQGYPACTVLRLNDSAAITADRGMAKAMSENGIRVTLIDEGYFALPPHKYGFIGGSAGVDGDTVYFTGDVSRHPGYGKILKAVAAEKMNISTLSADVPLDVGGILFC